MTENISPHPSPLPPRGEGVRRRIFTLLLSKLQKRDKNAKEWEKNLKNFRSSNSSREKLHPNVVAVLFVTVLTCCC